MAHRQLTSRALIAVAILAIVAVVPAAARVFPVDPAGLARAIEAQERHTDQLMAVAGVVGTAVGLRADGKHVVEIFAETTGVAGLPRELDGIPVQVQVTGKIFARRNPCSGPPSQRPPECNDGGGGGGGGVAGSDCPDTTGRYRPACIGISTGHPAITAGTIGCRVTAGSSVYALSNNHVYANQNYATIGDDVIQPGTYDGGSTSTDVIGSLSAFEPIQFCSPYPSNCPENRIDAAIAQSTTALLGNATPLDGYGTPQSTTSPAAIRMKVQKYGRTTKLTNGRVDAINATVYVNYGNGRVARFVHQITIKPGTFSAGGDSGSLIVGDGGPNDGKPVALLFAGSSSMTVANPIDEVLAGLGAWAGSVISIDGE